MQLIRIPLYIVTPFCVVAVSIVSRIPKRLAQSYVSSAYLKHIQ